MIRGGRRPCPHSVHISQGDNASGLARRFPPSRLPTSRLFGFGDGLITEGKVKVACGDRRLSAPCRLDDGAKLQHVLEALEINFGISGKTRRRVGYNVIALAGDLGCQCLSRPPAVENCPYIIVS